MKPKKKVVRWIKSQLTEFVGTIALAVLIVCIFSDTEGPPLPPKKEKGK